jgi:hypothetical protein
MARKFAGFCRNKSDLAGNKSNPKSIDLGLDLSEKSRHRIKISKNLRHFLLLFNHRNGV